MNLLRKLIREIIEEIATRFPPERMMKLQGLAAEARKAGSYEEFKKDYLRDIKHGQYWHVTSDPKFFIDASKGPRDMSSMANNRGGKAGDLMFTSDLENWADYYGKERTHAALLDLSSVPREAYRQSARGFGNEFYLSNASNSGARVVKVVTVGTAKKMSKQYDRLKPQSYEELEEFYNLVVQTPT